MIISHMASAQQVWLDLNNPDNLHAVFIYSAVADNAWADRTSLYFGSTDAGETWFEVGAVPVNNGTTVDQAFLASLEPPMVKLLLQTIVILKALRLTLKYL